MAGVGWAVMMMPPSGSGDPGGSYGCGDLLHRAGRC